MFALVIFTVLAVVFGFMQKPASAQPGYLDAFIDFNPWIVNTTLADCITCHLASSTDRNPFGQDLDTWLQQNPGYTIYNAMENVYASDSDGDVWLNYEEIERLTFPGDSSDYPECVDNDGDGSPHYLEWGSPCSRVKDCNDNDAEMFPGNPEVCFNSKNNDCDNYVLDNTDPDCSSACTDFDNDSYSVEGGICGPVDCNDFDPGTNPAACDIKNDGIDQNCDGSDRTKGKPCK